MALVPDPGWRDFIDGCRRQKSECELTIQSLRTGELRMLAGEPGGQLEDVTARHIEQLESIVVDMSRLIAECESEESVAGPCTAG